jgi:rhodanese-related sulfurtransferase
MKMLTIHFLSLLLIACQLAEPTWIDTKAQIRKKFPDVQQLSIREFQKKYSTAAFVVDVREPEEYEVSHLRYSVNLTDAGSIVKNFRKSGKHVLVLYCSVGYRSSKIAQQVQSSVSKPVYNLEGSLFEWANSGLPVYRGQKFVTGVHPYNSYWAKLLDKKYRE